MQVNRAFRRSIVVAIAICCATINCASASDDYQKPIQQFEDACNVVIAASRQFLNNENTIEQNKAIDDAVFQKQVLEFSDIDQIEIITPAEIKVRTSALDALSQYTTNLSALAQGKSGTDVGGNSKKLSDSLTSLSTDAKKLPVSKSSFLNNAKFSGVASAAASAIGVVAQMIIEHKTKRELVRSIADNDPAVTALIQYIADDMTLSFDRQKNQLGAYGSQLSRAYEKELKLQADPIVLLSFAQILKSYRAQQVQLASANPAAAIEKMTNAHQAMVAYVSSDDKKKGIAKLSEAMQEFVSAAEPLGQAVQTMTTSATK